MNRIFSLFLISCLGLLIILGCQNPISKERDQSQERISANQEVSYQSKRKEIKSIQALAKKNYLNASDKKKELEKVGKLMDSLIYYQLIPYWKGTAWTYTGHTDTPGQGTVACGYFVSTTLKHVGFNLNRFKLAQAASKQAGEKLVGTGNLHVLTGTPAELKKHMLKNAKPGLYFLGLDFHEAYLWLTADELYIVHSNYINNAGVMQEKATESSALAASKSFWFAPIGGTASLTQKWLLSNRIN